MNRYKIAAINDLIDSLAGMQKTAAIDALNVEEEEIFYNKLTDVIDWLEELKET